MTMIRVKMKNGCGSWTEVRKPTNNNPAMKCCTSDVAALFGMGYARTATFTISTKKPRGDNYHTFERVPRGSRSCVFRTIDTTRFAAITQWTSSLLDRALKKAGAQLVVDRKLIYVWVH